MNNNAADIKEMITKYRSLLRKSPNAVGLIATNLFKESFTRKGQIMANGTVIPWQQRGFSPANRQSSPLLIKSGQLRREIHYNKSATGVNIISSMPYSELMNEGGEIQVTAKMRKFFYAMFRQSGGEIVKGKPKGGDQFWFRMIFAKKITVPKRPFFYDTPELPKRMDDYFIKQLTTIFKQ
jgi:phage gpG-like protein